MFLAKVVGQVVSTQKDSRLVGQKLAVLRPLQVGDETSSSLLETKNTVVAVDACSAAVGQIVMYAQGSSARQADGMKELPIDAAIIGIVDNVEAFSKTVYKSEK